MTQKRDSAGFGIVLPQMDTTWEAARAAALEAERLGLGIGAGWYAGEHEAYGYAFGTPEQACEQGRRYQGLGVSHFITWVPERFCEQTVATLGERLVPAFGA